MWSALDMSSLSPAPTRDRVPLSPIRQSTSLPEATRIVWNVDLRVKWILWVCIVTSTQVFNCGTYIVSVQLKVGSHSKLVVWSFKYNLLFLQLAKSRGKSLVERVVKEQVGLLMHYALLRATGRLTIIGSNSSASFHVMHNHLCRRYVIATQKLKTRIKFTIKYSYCKCRWQYWS